MDIELDYPDDVRTIAHYLVDNDISMSKEKIQRKYKEFSDEVYSAGWMCVNDDLLEEFCSWLENYEVKIDYPNDVKIISDYLHEKDIVMSKEDIQDKYREFSDEVYAADWMCVNNDLLEEFCSYLKE